MKLSCVELKSLNEALFLLNVIQFPKLLGDHFGFSLENVGDHLGAGTDFEFHLRAGLYRLRVPNSINPPLLFQKLLAKDEVGDISSRFCSCFCNCSILL